MYKETFSRSFVKSFSWRAAGTLTTIGIVYFFTNKMTLSLLIGGFESVVKMAVYFFHERLWDRISFGKHELQPEVIWFTGLSGAGKTTIAEKVCQDLRQRGRKVELLDGDTIRNLFPGTGFTKADRDQHIQRIGHLASQLAKHGVTVVAAFISPYEACRQFVRSLCPNFLEVYVSTSLEECERRDVKGLYAKARRGEIQQFTGIDDPYEIPKSPELVINTLEMPVNKAVSAVLHAVDVRSRRREKGRHGFLGRAREQKHPSFARSV